MKYIHSVEFKAFLKEDIDQYHKKISQLISEKTGVPKEDFSKKEIITKIEVIEGTEDFPENITVAFYAIRKPKLAEKFLQEVQESLAKSLEDTDRCIDEHAIAYIRIDKKAFLDTGAITTVEHGDCIHMKIKIAAYPSNKENAIKVWEAFIHEMR